MPNGPLILLYDGRCRFCTAWSQRIVRWSRSGKVRVIDLHGPEGAAVLSQNPAISPEAAMASIHAVAADGRVYRGLGAIVRALWTRGALRPMLWLYFVPGLRQAADWAYRVVARNRYRLGGRTKAGEACGTACRPAR